MYVTLHRNRWEDFDPNNIWFKTTVIKSWYVNIVDLLVFIINLFFLISVGKNIFIFYVGSTS